MPSLTIKNIPASLFDRLKLRAAQNRRSLNNEVLECLERELMPAPEMTEQELMARLDARCEELRGRGVAEPGPEELEQWINWGRE